MVNSNWCGYLQIGLIFFTDIFNDFVAGFEDLLGQPEYAMVGILAFFALVHSGLAFLRPYGAAFCQFLSLLSTQPLLLRFDTARDVPWYLDAIQARVTAAYSNHYTSVEAAMQLCHAN